MEDNFSKVIKQLQLTPVDSEDTLFFEKARAFFNSQIDSLYEYNWLHIAVYNAYDKEVYYCEQSYIKAFILINKDANSLIFFAPIILDLTAFHAVLTEIQSLGIQVTFQSVSKSWIEKNVGFLSTVKYLIAERSLNEVIYSTTKLSNLEGKVFSKLRYTKNKFEGQVIYETLNELNLNGALHVLETWQEHQGVKYSKNKFEKEKNLLCRISKGNIPEEIECKLVKVDKNYLGYYLLMRQTQEKKSGIIYLLKGLNRAEFGGLNGITDAIYLHIFQTCKEEGLEFLNDGDLGKERGTIEHKLRFWPVDRLQYFDLILI